MKMNSVLKIFFLFAFASLFFFSCKKQPGIGGDATINGNVHAQHFNTTFTQFISEYPGADVYVYLVPGNDITYIKRIKTDYNGNYEFKFLYPGKYKVYAYSLDSSFSQHTSTSSGSIPVIDSTIISGRKDVITLDTIRIFN
mgnify:CR=1 FL=1